jgi:hypothetical protein
MQSMLQRNKRREKAFVEAGIVTVKRSTASDFCAFVSSTAPLMLAVKVESLSLSIRQSSSPARCLAFACYSFPRFSLFNKSSSLSSSCAAAFGRLVLTSNLSLILRRTFALLTNSSVCLLCVSPLNKLERAQQLARDCLRPPLSPPKGKHPDVKDVSIVDFKFIQVLKRCDNYAALRPMNDYLGTSLPIFGSGPTHSAQNEAIQGC